MGLKPRDRKALLNRAAAAIETPDDLTEEERAQVVEDLVAESESDDRVFVYTMGVVHCSVCAPAGMEREVIEKRVNAENPTETSHPWTVSKEETFSGGQKNPSPCDQDGARLHYLMEC